jgi:MtN3 and saliva related transmembrane protein
MKMAGLRLVGWFAAICTSFGFVPQIIKGIKTKKLDDLSWGLLWITVTGVSAWLGYGVVLNDIILILANAITGTSLIILIILKIRYKKNS